MGTLHEDICIFMIIAYLILHRMIFFQTRAVKKNTFFYIQRLFRKVVPFVR